MCSNILPCPLCSQPNFPTVDSLRISLVNVTNRQLACPICNQILIGLDKLTIHLFSHTMMCSNSTSTSISATTSIAPTLTATTYAATTATNAKEENQNKDDKVDDDDNDATEHSIENKSFENGKSVYEAKTSDECKKIQQSSKLSSSPLHQSITLIPPPPPPPPPPLPPTSINNIYELSRDSTIKIAFPPSIQSSRTTASSPPPPPPPPPPSTIVHEDENTLFIEPQCDICGLTFRNNELHSMHMKLVHEIDITDVNINNLLMINRSHKIVCMDEENQSQKSRYQCHLCSKSFKMKGSLRVHLRVVHLFGVPGVLSCGGGGSSIINNVRNNYHQMKIALERRNSNSPPIQNVAIKCEIDKSSLLTNAISAVNSNLPDELYTFTLNVQEHSGNNSPLQQQEEFDHRQQLQQQQQPQQHQQLSKHQPTSLAAVDSKVWECDICTKLFTTKYFLKKHKRLHTGEMPYTCEICAKTFTFQQSYHKHLLYHNDDKPHVCKECGRAFKELSTLHNHERIHSGEKPFKCETCDKCFRQRVSYLVHRRIHTGVMPYKCTACDKSFRYKVSQRTHKCMAQPPGTVIRQTGDLLQRLIQSTVFNSMQQISNTTLDDDHEDLYLAESPSNVETQTTNFSSQYSILNNNNLFNINHVCSTNSQGGVNGDGDGGGGGGGGGDSGGGGNSGDSCGTGIDECNDVRDVGSGSGDFNTEYGHQSLDELVEEHCNKIGIGQNEINSFCDMDTTNMDHSFDISIPSPTEKFQNLCLYSPQPQSTPAPPPPPRHQLQTQTSQTLPLLTSSPQSSEEIFTHTLDTIEENLLKQFIYGKDI